MSRILVVVVICWNYLYLVVSLSLKLILRVWSDLPFGDAPRIRKWFNIFIYLLKSGVESRSKFEVHFSLIL